MKKLEGKVIAVFGASGGIGQELCAAFHAEGARLGLIARQKDKLDQLALRLGGDGQVAVLPADAGESEAVEWVFHELVKIYGQIDAVVISVGTHKSLSIDAPAAEAVAQADQLYGAIFKPAFLVAWVAQQFFRQQAGGGLIANISSHAAVRTDLPDNHVYAPMKAAIWSYVQGLMNAIKDPNVRIVDLKPATVNTPGNEKWLNTDAKKAAAVQPGIISQWIIDHIDTPDADLPTTVTFDAPVN